MNVRRIASADDLSAVADEWRLLEDRNYLRAVWLTYEWFHHWAKCRGTPGNLFVLAVENNGSLLAVAPLIRASVTKFGCSVRQLQFACEECTSEFILAPEQTHECIAAVMDYILAQQSEWDILRLKKIRADSPVTALLKEVILVKRVPFAQNTDAVTPYIPVEGTWEDYVRALPGDFKRNIRRALAKLERFGPVAVVNYPRAGSYEDTLRAVFDIADASWQATQGTAVSSPQTDRAFFESFSREADRRGWLDIHLLTVAGTAVAFEYNIRYLGTLYAFKCGYDSKYVSASPGTCLRYLAMQGAFSLGIEEIDLMGSSDFFSSRWSREGREHLELRVYNLSWRTLLPYIYEARLVPWLKRYAWIRKLKTRMGGRMK